MSFEDGAVLGLCLKSVTKQSSTEDKRRALGLYEKCRISRTNAIVDRGNVQQELNHLDDGPEQIARDEKMRAYAAIEEQCTRANNTDWSTLPTTLSQGLQPGNDPLVWRRFGAGQWLLSYVPEEDVAKVLSSRL